MQDIDAEAHGGDARAGWSDGPVLEPSTLPGV